MIKSNYQVAEECLKNGMRSTEHCYFIVLAVLETLLRSNQTSEFNNC